MPSGAKKRKAAKKKKESQNQSNDHSDSAPAHSHGDEDVKHQDDRESNVAEVSSPTSPDHEKLPVEAEAAGASSMEGSRVDNWEERVGLEKEIKIEYESGVKDGIINHDEANRKPYDGGSSGSYSSSSSSSSSSSDDESRGLKKGQDESSIASGVSVEMDDSLSGKPVEPVCDSNVDSSISATIESDMLSQAAISEAPHVVESTLEESGGEKFDSVKERICTPVEEADVGSTESTPKTLDPKECVTQEIDERSTFPGVALDDGVQRVKDSVVTQPVVAPSPDPDQKTSWKSCCGLFEVFSGSAH
ncbi:uncharacterized protein LOC130985306 [Salvia miltiorrhiza]|uniref:uncharacterized protein LOC130985306 n=1 Tax=Salvia miltiorrhiza TaxID=226208 RepID=UPI0025ABEC8F|nr:uncharacterized protein LOC130985306 [Salvia miltiorrhiza]XP_057764201.1 uncharacterized protein LOC130985306 [Salvia miltiorrhiza]XP_057764202.1 uncharacterized protein LOC130985306 [Salvia miltiorrhiza]XP_057764203.1 uncharacterized protein LOC130985306 [Salvia miltiorrhiza]XP_057764204.1 uncharacterized protein LOC130985306 [Salvia miltiorrhiza]